MALVSVMTNTFSEVSVSIAGKLLGTLIGIGKPPWIFHGFLQAEIIRPNITIML